MTEAQGTELIALAQQIVHLATFGIGVLFALIVASVVKYL